MKRIAFYGSLKPTAIGLDPWPWVAAIEAAAKRAEARALRGTILLTAGIIAAGLAFASSAGATDVVFDTSILQGLDKVTGRVMTIDAPVGAPVHFGTLEIIVRTCRKRPPEEQPESAAFLDIWEIRSGQAAASLFRGWMFASSPALSALEHPVYDIWVLDCEDSKAKTSAPARSP